MILIDIDSIEDKLSWPKHTSPKYHISSLAKLSSTKVVNYTTSILYIIIRLSYNYE